MFRNQVSILNFYRLLHYWKAKEIPNRTKVAICIPRMSTQAFFFNPS
jgi:hypothetical protein